MNILSTLVAFLGALGVLIVVHEMGHFLVARWCGVKVLRFSLGFGRPLLQRKFGRDQTEWVLAVIPFGGYVAMLDEREVQSRDIDPNDLPRAFNRQSVGKRAAIVAAGPLANFLLAIVIYVGLGLHGVDEPRALLGKPPAASLAAASDLSAALLSVPDGKLEVHAINGEVVRSMVDLRWKLLQLGLARASLSLDLVASDGQRRQVTLDLSELKASELEGDFMRHIGLVAATPRPVLGQLSAGGAAERVGLKTGDTVLAIDAQPVGAPERVVELIRAAPGRPLGIDVQRDGTVLHVRVTPDARDESGVQVGRIGAAVRAVYPTTNVRYGPIDAVSRSVAQVWQTSALTLRMMGKMIVGEVSLKNLTGPVTIADYAGQSARIGAITYLTFIAFISISIGLMNLLPIPMLDGGHLLYYLVEILLRRAPPERFIEWSQRAGVAVLAGLMLVALFNDVVRLIS